MTAIPGSNGSLVGAKLSGAPTGGGSAGELIWDEILESNAVTASKTIDTPIQSGEILGFHIDLIHNLGGLTRDFYFWAYEALTGTGGFNGRVWGGNVAAARTGPFVMRLSSSIAADDISSIEGTIYLPSSDDKVTGTGRFWCLGTDQYSNFQFKSDSNAHSVIDTLLLSHNGAGLELKAGTHIKVWRIK